MEIGDCPDWYECRTKWQNLRVTFNRNITKLHKIRSGQIGTRSVRVNWRFFDAMQFVLKSNTDDPTMAKNSETTTMLCDTATATSATASSICESPSDSSTCDTATAPPKCQTSKFRSRHKRSKRSYICKPTLVKRSIKLNAEQPLQCFSQPDEFTAFGEYVASELRCISYADAQILKRRMARILLDFHEERRAS